MEKEQQLKALIDEARCVIRTRPEKATMVQRMQIMLQADEQVAGLPQPLQLGQGVSYIGANAATPVDANDILVGRIPLVVPDAAEEKIVDTYREKFGNAPSWLPDSGHTGFYWQDLVEWGLPGLLNRVQNLLDTDDTLTEKDRIFLQGKLGVYRGYLAYISRYAQAAEQAGKPEAAALCRALLAGPPQSFAQALQLFLLVGIFFTAYSNLICVLSYGRMDRLLLPLYRADLAKGIPRQQLAAYLTDFYCKNCLILGRGEHQLSAYYRVKNGQPQDDRWLRNPCYDSPQYIIVGGYADVPGWKNGTTGGNELTNLFLECCDPQMKNPVLIYRYTENQPEGVYPLLCQKLIENASILVYNDATEIPAFCHSGIAEEDAVQYGMFACNWPEIPGLTNISYAFHEPNASPAHILARLLTDGKPLPDMDTLYARLKQCLQADLTEAYRKMNAMLAQREADRNSLLLVKDCFLRIEPLQLSFMAGGQPYSTFFYTLKNFATAADILTAVDTLVFREKKVSLLRLSGAMQTDFKEDPLLRALCLRCEKFGTDGPLSNFHAKKLMELYQAVADEAAAADKAAGGKLICLLSTTNDMLHIIQGLQLCATPDGRLSGEQVSENLSPSILSKPDSLAALLSSMTNLPFEKVASGALNIRLRKELFSGEKGCLLLQQLMRSYFARGGMQLQISVADTTELLDAQKHPENHRDLMVRITGYSAIFVDMTEEAQNEFIRRCEMGL